MRDRLNLHLVLPGSLEAAHRENLAEDMQAKGWEFPVGVTLWWHSAYRWAFEALDLLATADTFSPHCLSVLGLWHPDVSPSVPRPQLTHGPVLDLLNGEKWLPCIADNSNQVRCGFSARVLLYGSACVVQGLARPGHGSRSLGQPLGAYGAELPGSCNGNL